MPKQYSHLEKALHNFKGLSEIEAKLLIKIIERTRVTVKEVNKLLKGIGKEKSSSRSYQLLSSLEKQDLITEDKEATPKTFFAIHPRALLGILEENRDNIRKDILALEEAQDLFEPEKEKNIHLFKTFKNVNEIVTNLYRLSGDGFEIKLILKQDAGLDPLFERVKDIVKLEPRKSDINTILLQNDKSGEKAILFLTAELSPEGASVIRGNLQKNCELFNYLIKKEGKAK